MSLLRVSFSIMLFCLLALVCETKRSNKIKLKDVQTLTLRSDQWTTSRRSSPIRQLVCVGGYCNKVYINTAQCYNRGFDGTDVQWECKAQMPSNYKFGRVEVSCEGFDYPEDDYVLAGSCGLEYTIDEVSPSSRSYNKYANYDHLNLPKGSSNFWPVIGILLLMGLIYYTCLRSPTSSSSSYTSSDDSYPRPSAPPPPPGFRSDFFNNSGDSCGSSSRTRSSGSSTSSGPGFFSGMAAGGLMGYLFGSSRSNQPYSRTRTYYNEPSSYSYPSSSFGSSSSSTETTHTSSGFGGTRRR